MTAIDALRARAAAMPVGDRWLRYIAAVVYVVAGLLKLFGAPIMVEIFAAIGVGQWFRYLTGVLELAGAAALLVPWLAGLAATGLLGVMAGAMLCEVFVMHRPPLAAGALFAVVGIVAWKRRRQTLGVIRGLLRRA